MPINNKRGRTSTAAAELIELKIEMFMHPASNRTKTFFSKNEEKNEETYREHTDNPAKALVIDFVYKFRVHTTP